MAKRHAHMNNRPMLRTFSTFLFCGFTLTLLIACETHKEQSASTAVDTARAPGHVEQRVSPVQPQRGGTAITPSEIEWQKFMMAQERYATTELHWKVLIQGQYGEYVLGYIEGNRNFKVALTGPYPLTYKEAIDQKLLPPLQDNQLVTVNGLFYHGVTSFPLVVVTSIAP